MSVCAKRRAIFPMYPGNPQATFQFPTQLWMRGLLGGYLNGGNLPVTTDKTKCPVILLTGKLSDDDRV